MEKLLGRVKQGFWTFTGLNFKWKHEHKQWEHHFARGGNSPCQMTNFARWISPCQNFARWISPYQNFARGFSSWCEIWPFRTMKKPPCKIWTFHLPPLRNAFEIPCFETLLMIFHCPFSKIFCLTFSFVNTYFTLVINQWKGCFCNSSCNLAFYCL